MLYWEVRACADGCVGVRSGETDTQQARLGALWSLSFLPDGKSAWIADQDAHAIRAVNLTNNKVTTVAGTGTEGDQDGPATSAQFSSPLGITVMPDGSRALVAEYGNHKSEWKAEPRRGARWGFRFFAPRIGAVPAKQSESI